MEDGTGNPVGHRFSPEHLEVTVLMRKWIQILLSEIHCRRPLFWFLHPHHDASHTLSILHWCYHRHESYSLNLNELMASATKNSLAWLEKVLTAVLHMVWVPVFKRKMRKLILKLNELGQKVKVVFFFFCHHQVISARQEEAQVKMYNLSCTLSSNGCVWFVNEASLQSLQSCKLGCSRSDFGPT